MLFLIRCWRVDSSWVDQSKTRLTASLFVAESSGNLSGQFATNQLAFSQLADCVYCQIADTEFLLIALEKLGLHNPDFPYNIYLNLVHE